MNGKSVAMLVVLAFVTGGTIAQTPESKPRPEPRVFSWSFDSEGGYLGVQTEEVNRENLAKFNLREVRGVAVAKVVENSPAQAAGLQEGDVIVKVNGDEVTSSRKLTRLISEISPDHTARLTVLRSGSERDINVTMGKRPAPKFGEGAFSFPDALEKLDIPDIPELKALPRIEMTPGAPGTPKVFTFGTRRQIGVGLISLSKQLSDHFGVTNGALVDTVREDSPAAKAGLKAGDIIVEVDGKAVKGDLDIVRAISEKKDGDISITFVRDRNRQTVRVAPEEVKGGIFERYYEFESVPPSPEIPGRPGVFKLDRPGRPSPVPLNQLFVPGRIV